MDIPLTVLSDISFEVLAVKIEHFQHRAGDARLRSALHVDAEGTVMPDVFYNAATRYGAGKMQPLFDRVRAQYRSHMSDMLAELSTTAPPRHGRARVGKRRVSLQHPRLGS